MNTKDLLLGGMVLGGGNGGGSVIIPNISATAESIDAGQDASVQQTGTDTNIVFNFQIPRGFDGPMGAQGPRGLTGAQGPVGATGPAGQSGQEGPAGPQGIQGPEGPAGTPFLIYKVYPTVDEMNAGFETDGIQEGQLVGISQETGGEQGGYLYIKGAKEYQFFFDINKIDGIQGPQGEQGPQGPQGAQGPAGKDGQTGPAGPQGENGVGVPAGGTAGQFLAKASDTDYDTVWQDAPSGSGITLQSIQITTPPNQTEYNAGQTFNNTGMVVTAFYNYNLSQIVTGYTVSPSGVLTGDITAVTITYSEGGVLKTATQPITVTRLTGTLSVDPTWVSLDADTQATEVQVTYNGDGELSVQSSAPDIVSAEISGATVLVKSLTDTSQTVTVTLTAPETGVYTSATAELTVKNYVTTHVFGCLWDTSNPSTQLIRLTPETDPLGVVTETVESEPQPAVGTGAGSSPFDAFMPWAGMKRYNVIDGAVAYSEDDPQFSQTDYDTVVYIPPFYYRRETVDGKQGFYTGNNQFEGSSLHPRSGSYIARYTLGENYDSKSGKVPILGDSRSQSRNKCHEKGANWWLWDSSAWGAIWMLYLVEFADWNSDCIGLGNVNNSSAIQSGGTDMMQYHTGYAGENGKSCVQYRWVENPFGNANQWVDGIIFYNKTPYICLNPDQYSDSDISNYAQCGVEIPANGFITNLQINEENSWVFVPQNSSGGSSTTYIPDYMNSGAGTTALSVGGSWNYTTYSGMFCYNALYPQDGGILASSTTGRLMFIPDEVQR